jgi:hypothetical protein
MNDMGFHDRVRYPYTTTIRTRMAENDGTDENPSYSYHYAKRIFHSSFQLGKEEIKQLKECPTKVYWSDDSGKNFTFDRPINKEKTLWITDEFFNNELTQSEGYIQKEDK